MVPEKEKAAKFHIEPNTLFQDNFLEPATCVSRFFLFSYGWWTCWSILGVNRPAYTCTFPWHEWKYFDLLCVNMYKLYADLAQNSWNTHGKKVPPKMDLVNGIIRGGYDEV